MHHVFFQSLYMIIAIIYWTNLVYLGLYIDNFIYINISLMVLIDGYWLSVLKICGNKPMKV